MWLKEMMVCEGLNTYCTSFDNQNETGCHALNRNEGTDDFKDFKW